MQEKGKEIVLFILCQQLFLRKNQLKIVKQKLLNKELKELNKKS